MYTIEYTHQPVKNVFLTSFIAYRLLHSLKHFIYHIRFFSQKLFVFLLESVMHFETVLSHCISV